VLCGFTWQDEATPALAACTTLIPKVPVKREITKEHATRKAEKRFRMTKKALAVGFSTTT